jgi:glucose/arabinose dehydrogenase
MNYRKNPILIGLFLFALLLLAFFSYKAPQTREKSKQNPPIQSKGATPTMTVIAKNLDVPWAMAFLPNGDMLFTERPGRVRLLDKNNELQPSLVIRVNDVRAVGEGGLLGIAVHPDFRKNHFVYLYYTYAEISNNNMLNRVVRYTYENGAFNNRLIIVDKIPGNGNHNGGRLKFGPDRFLYITTGDAENPSLAQNKNSLGGKILRVKDDGSPALDNPFNNRIYSYGHRNPQGITWDGTVMYETEHGPSAPSCCDEINRIEPGKNYGWPEVKGDETKVGTEKSLLQSGDNSNDTWAPSGTTFHNGSIFYAGLRGKALYEAKVNGATAIIASQHFKDQLGRIRDVVVGPDDMLYITTSNNDGRGTPSSEDDKIIRLNF